MDEKPIPIHEICKICLQNFEDMVNLFTEDSKEILSKLQSCFQISFSYDKLKPTEICGNCVDDLTNAESLRLKCLTADERFTNYCSQLDKNSCKVEKLVVLDHIDSDVWDYSEPNHTKNIADPDLHAEIHNNIADTNKFPCAKCGKVLKTLASLLKHNISMHERRKHVGNVSGFGNARRYHCSSCPYTTPHSQTLVNHMRRHNGDRPYSCHCGKTFTQSSSLAAHQKTHSDVTYFTCSYCGKQFKHAFALTNHLRVHNSPSFTCNICCKSLKSKQSLRAHMNRHLKIHNYNCEDCGDTFVTSAELLNHRKKHDLKKNMECHLCGYKTHTKKALIVHLKRHTGNRTFKCKMCLASFYTQSNLLRHGQVHTREKPFSCPACAQRYKYSPSLNKHMKVVHGVSYKWADFKWKEKKSQV